MTQEALIKRLQISCLGLDRIDPLCLLVDDVIEALAQTERTWVGLTDEEMRDLKQKSVSNGMTRIVSDFEYIRSIEAKLKELNT